MAVFEKEPLPINQQNTSICIAYWTTKNVGTRWVLREPSLIFGKRKGVGKTEGKGEREGKWSGWLQRGNQMEVRKRRKKQTSPQQNSGYDFVFFSLFVTRLSLVSIQRHVRSERSWRNDENTRIEAVFASVACVALHHWMDPERWQAFVWEGSCRLAGKGERRNFVSSCSGFGAELQLQTILMHSWP